MVTRPLTIYSTSPEGGSWALDLEVNMDFTPEELKYSEIKEFFNTPERELAVRCENKKLLFCRKTTTDKKTDEDITLTTAATDTLLSHIIHGDNKSHLQVLLGYKTRAWTKAEIDRILKPAETESGRCRVM